MEMVQANKSTTIGIVTCVIRVSWRIFDDCKYHNVLFSIVCFIYIRFICMCASAIHCVGLRLFFIYRWVRRLILISSALSLPTLPLFFASDISINFRIYCHKWVLTICQYFCLRVCTRSGIGAYPELFTINALATSFHPTGVDFTHVNKRALCVTANCFEMCVYPTG